MRTGVPPPTARPTGIRRYQSWLVSLAVVVLLAQMAFVMVTAAREESQTADEGVYVAAAVVYLRQHSLRYNPEHPPLAKLVMATGLAFADPRIDTRPEFTEFQAGTDVIYGHGNGAQRVLWYARLPMIVLTLLFGLVVFAFARDIAGWAGGLLALALYAFSPDVITFGSLAGVDAPAAGFLLTAAWLVWRARRRPWWYLPPAGIALGAALATKMNTLAAAPVVLLLAGVSVWSAQPDKRRTPRLLTAAGAAAGTGVLALATVWLTYLIVDPHLRWVSPPDLPVISGMTGRLVDWLPLPRPFRDGMRIQLGLEERTNGGFLLGEAYSGHRWYYLPAALLIKTPLGMLALWLAGATTMLTMRRLRPAALYVLLPTAVLLVAAMQGARDWGVRYALFVPVLLAVAAAAVTVVPRWPVRAVAALLVAFVAVSSARAFPYYLPYSNEAFGGPSKTYLRLGQSNVDWYQDLYRLGKHMRERYPGEPVWLVHRHSAVAGYYGITVRDPLKVPPSQVGGLLAVSATHVAYPSPAIRALIDRGVLIDQVGHSIMIYRLPPARPAS
ncbi:phospholipid carrier-dependent glycosyltransferase [Amorphoplanes nipponensis]|uniref:Glycosyl transferase n=1 Tax=Actinoplanes nipponensis TaxID=135950 RepID=A0A919JK41_9ACTN|nr:phospholipid carrier-dependent glycosyltransferase [Actinoplanes nipponensis]GIE51143.1 glycosyl transferase [Actinoplanes nipponensis]